MAKEKQPWEKHGISEELYNEIYGKVKEEVEGPLKESLVKELVPEITEQVRRRVLEEADNLAKNDNDRLKIDTPRADAALKDLAEFKVKLNHRRAMWQTKDKSLDLSIFGRSMSDVIKKKSLSADTLYEIKRAMEANMIVLTGKDEEEKPPETRQISKGGNVQAKTLSDRVPAKIKEALNHPERTVIGEIHQIDNLEYLNILLEMERQSRNTAGKTRPNVINAINERIRAIPLKGIIPAKMIDSEVTEEGPDEESVPATAKIGSPSA